MGKLADREGFVLVVGGSGTWADELSAQVQWNHEIGRVDDGNGALEQIEKTREVDLIVITADHLGMQIAEFYRHLCEKAAEPPELLALVADAGPDSIGEIPPDAIDLVPAGLDPELVRSRIDRLLALRKNRRALEQRVAQLHDRLEHANVVLVETLLRCTAYKDDEYGRHVQRINEYSTLLARLLGMPETYCRNLGLASMLHDIGKVSVPDSILQKPGKLDPDEWEVVKQHCTEGASILGDPGESTLLNMTRRIILSHHEKWDGTGYPAGLFGRDIPLEGRIVALADVLDALTTDLPYKKAWSMAEATRYIRSQSGMHFDPELVGLFTEHVDEFVEIKTRLADILVEEEVADRR